jgi:phosphopantothenate-cysteine ligase/phosphopantothenoylcysteine decarboxylase/phosphopantothenate--cysteine ligase
MKVLITAGSTKVSIDQVRAITNIFKGKTGTNIAKYFGEQGCKITLVTSSPEKMSIKMNNTEVISFRTFDDLRDIMKNEIVSGAYDVIVHSAAVSDYKVDGFYVQGGDGTLDVVDNSKKVSSKYKSAFIKLVPTEKIVDKIRSSWNFQGILVKFKLEVGISDGELIAIAKKSRVHSGADIIVANCLEWARKRAYIIDEHGVEEYARHNMSERLFAKVIKRR